MYPKQRSVAAGPRSTEAFGVGRGAAGSAPRPWAVSGPCGYLLGPVGLEDLLALLPRPDADGVLDREQEDLPVPDRTAAGVAQDRLLDDPDVPVLHDHLELQLRPQVDLELRAAVVLGDPL